ncbi:MAG TPA: hypothetical protein VFY48_01830 [Solirubrobacterales bacterium]|nr:hypothetical protein [Solirubrobacterales bacterium]
MLSRLREHLGGAGLIVAVVALSVALAGGAIAANGGSGDGKATASAKAKKGPRGPKGPKGDTGPAGPAGPAGPQGAKGDTGAAGANGSNGSNGSDGAKGATGATGPSGTQGAKGATGATGPTGLSGFTKTLPPGETETGTYSIVSENGEPQVLELPYAVDSISFSIPLAAPLDDSHVKYAPNAGPLPAECENSAHAGTASVFNPEAQPGYLCVYGGVVSGNLNVSAMEIFTPSGFGPGANVSGTLLLQEIEGPEAYGAGTWAVTAPVPGP